MNFRFYIIDNSVFGGVKGTNNKEIAKEFSDYDDCIVIDSEAGAWITSDVDVEIEEIS